MALNDNVDILRYGALLDAVRDNKPLVHHITNYVTVNDCANITLATGASPVMADEPDDAREIAAAADAVVLNMGTLNSRTIPAMLTAGRAANENNVPVVLDPVGVGASSLRNDTARRLLQEISLTVVRGNISEIRYLAGLHQHTKGVDASASDIADSDDARSIAR
ncbi:MAG: hydroxyethylthiazole kinase, partial [Coriobacteriales bacterium]|nr:hydroxyethylthiazole kinase [Coriobacteriales bacterium]